MRNFTFWKQWCVSTFFGLLYLEKYCAEWDATLNRLLDKHWQEASLGRQTITLGPAQVWVSNAFYSYGHWWGPGSWDHRRPSVKTMLRLHRLELSLRGRGDAPEKVAESARIAAMRRLAE